MCWIYDDAETLCLKKCGLYMNWACGARPMWALQLDRWVSRGFIIVNQIESPLAHSSIPGSALFSVSARKRPRPRPRRTGPEDASGDRGELFRNLGAAASLSRRIFFHRCGCGGGRQPMIRSGRFCAPTHAGACICSAAPGLMFSAPPVLPVFFFCPLSGIDVLKGRRVE